MKDVTLTDARGQSIPFNLVYTDVPLQNYYNVSWTGGPVSSPAQRTYILNYTVTNAFSQPSQSQNGIDWNVVGGGWNAVVEDLNATVYLPGSFTNSSAFSYSPSDGKVSTEAGEPVL